MTAAGSAFDRLALSYDELWDGTAVGTSQRRAVWHELESVVRPGDRILDLGCGTGTDALHLRSVGAAPLGIDSSAEMVRIARQRGVEALQLPFERLSELNESFDGAISNFGALNCVESLSQVASDLARLISPGGYFAACLMGPCCAWEVVHFLLKRKPRKAIRRFRMPSVSWMGMEIRYPGGGQIEAEFRPHFRLVRWCGIGLLVPPSYIKGMGETWVLRLAKVDAYLSHAPLIRALSDHRLLVFERI